MITKLGNIILQPHQQRVVDRLTKEDIDGLIAYHSLGSGKSATSLAATERVLEENPKGRALFITPASLQENIYKELRKHKMNIPEDRILVRSYEKALREADELQKEKFPIIVLDEAHKLRNTQTERAKKLKAVIENAKKKLLLTGTAGYNHPADVGVLAKYIDPNLKLPKTQEEFDFNYVDKHKGGLTPNGKKLLQDQLSKYVDIYDATESPDYKKNFPRSNTKIIDVRMSDPQQKVYRYLEQKIPKHLQRAVRSNLPLSLKDSTNLNAFSTGIRQASTGHFPYQVEHNYEDSPKLMAAVNSMAESAQAQQGFRGVAYSNYLGAGVEPYADLIKKRGLSPSVLTGSLSRKEKAKLVEDFNTLSPEAKVLVLSSSGGEGLDLKGVRKLQILEPHFNQSKIDQVKGRAVRYKSHDHLPEDQREVNIEEYHSYFQPNIFQKLFKMKPGTTIDKYLHDYSKRKQLTINDVKGSLR